ncbi:MAG: efflux RND transporter periplasmic adaptor subunit [Pseudomonadota bacterium]
MQRKTLLAGAGATVALALMLWWAFAPRPLRVETARAVVGPFETTIDEDGRTRLAERFVIGAPLAARVEHSALREGDAVAAGDVVAVLRPVPSPLLDERTRAEQRARLGAAEAGVARARTRIEAAQVALAQAGNELRRTEQLAQQGFVAPTKADADRLAAQAAQKELDTAVAGAHLAGHELDQARAALAAGGGADSGRTYPMRAPVGGRVLRILQPSEATVAPGTPLVELGDVRRLEVVAELLTTDALQARRGSAVRIERWGGPVELSGTVARVEPAAFTKVSARGVEEQRVNVIVEITSPPELWQGLGDGYRVGVRIVTRSESRVLKVPVSAVFPLSGSAAPGSAGPSPPGAGPAALAHAVFVFEGGRARLHPVRLQARNASEAWIAEGLAEGAEVIVYPPAAVSDGARVSAR